MFRAIPALSCPAKSKMIVARHRVLRMRTILRFAKDPRTETGIRELIADAEARLDALEARRAAAVTKMK